MRRTGVGTLQVLPFYFRPLLPSLVRLARIMAACACATAAGDGAEESEKTRLAIVYGAQNPYRQAARSLQRAADASGIDCFTIELRKGDEEATQRAARQLARANPAVIASAGSHSTFLALHAVPDVPVVSFMVLNLPDAPFAARDFPQRSRVTAVAADVSPDDWAAWIHLLQPDCRTIVVLHSSRTRQTAKALQLAAQVQGLTFRAIEADKERFPEAITALNSQPCDGVLMIPDAKIYNTPNVRRLLLWGIRQKKPVWAFSPGIVKAGAFAAQYANSQAVGTLAAEMVQALLHGKSPTELGLQYPRTIGRAVNEHTADMINATLSHRLTETDVVRYGDDP